MTNFNSISDLARSFQLRNAQTSLRSKLTALSQEATTGIKSDIAQSLGGDLGRISQIESRLTVLKNYSNNQAEAQGILSAMQSSLESIQSMSGRTGTALISDALVSSADTLDVYLNKAPGDLRSAIDGLNVSVGGRFVFSGSRTDHAPMASYDDFLASVASNVGGAATSADILASIDAFFDDPANPSGFSAIVFQGNDQGSGSIAIAPGRLLSPAATANSDQFRATLKGLAVMAYTAGRTDLDFPTRRELSRAAGQYMVEGQSGLIAAQTLIGVQEELVAKTTASTTAEASALSIARSGLISSDPYESAAALNEIEANLETLYALTARLSKLTLTDYL